ncbi:MAG: type III pantothenate kinase [Ruminococcus sp.]|nr:type III pantothenate kinase [Ruminococcus sp.]
MLSAVDIGNTNIKMGFFDNGELKFTFTFSTKLKRTADEYASDLYSLMRVNGIKKDDIDSCIISSVVPQVNARIVAAYEQVCGVHPLVVGPGVKTGLNIRIEDPSTLGADLVVACVAANRYYSNPTIVISMGTATVFCVLDKNGNMLGGPIAPGVNISLEALTQGTALLHSVSLDAPKSVIGKNTDKSIRAGVVWGAACMIDGMIDKIEAELGAKCALVATGGLSNYIIKNCSHPIEIRPDLIMQGLRIIYERNRS